MKMSQSANLWMSLGVLLGLISVAGCGTDRGTVEVKGTVTLDGSPVEGASVAFSPTGGSGKAAAGTTDASGNFKLTTFENGDGAIPGSYQVAVTKTAADAAAAAAPAGGASPDDIDALYQQAEQAGENVMAGAGDQPQPDETEYLVPKKYISPQTSGLTATVTDDPTQNTFTFELKTE